MTVEIMPSYYINIACFSFEIYHGHSIFPRSVPASCKNFVSLNKPQANKVILHLDIFESLELPTVNTNQIFDNGTSWKMFREGNDRFLVMQPGSFDTILWILRFNIESGMASLFLSEVYRKQSVDFFPFSYPLDQILSMYGFLHHDSIIIHSAGGVFADQCVVFSGRSGDGKTTLSKLLDENQSARILSDDRIVIQKSPTGFMAYGSPWPGEGNFSVNEGLPLKALCFLKKSDDNSLRVLDTSDAISRLMAVVSIPWYDDSFVHKGLSLCEKIVQDVPIYEFSFINARDAAEYIASRFR